MAEKENGNVNQREQEGVQRHGEKKTWDDDERSPFVAPAWYTGSTNITTSSTPDEEDGSSDLIDILKCVSRSSEPPEDTTRGVDYAFYVPSEVRKAAGWCFETGHDTRLASR